VSAGFDGIAYEEDQEAPEAAKKARSPRKLELQKANNTGPCPANKGFGPVTKCGHPPVDHRPIANTKDHFCYHPKCMGVCCG